MTVFKNAHTGRIGAPMAGGPNIEVEAGSRIELDDVGEKALAYFIGCGLLVKEDTPKAKAPKAKAASKEKPSS